MAQISNFSSDPAVLPAEVLKQTQWEPHDWDGLDTSVMEVSHRGKESTQVAEEAEKDFRDLLSILSNYKVLSYHGGGHGQFVAVPLNILDGKTSIGYADTDYQVASAIKEARKYYTPGIFDAKVIVDNLRAAKPVSEWQLSDNVAYTHYHPDEAIDGIAIDKTLDFGKDAVTTADFSLAILSHPINASRYSVIYAGVQKNIGSTGLTVVITRENLLGEANIACPSILDYSILNDNDSMPNTLPTLTWHSSSLVFKQLKTGGDVVAMDKIDQQEAELLYGVTSNNDFYRNGVTKANRSRMNVPFRLTNGALDKLFLEKLFAVGLHALRDHRTTGGMHTSIYNAVPLKGIKALTDFMAGFEHRHG